MRAKHSALDILFGHSDEHKSRNFSLSSFVHFPVSSLFLDPRSQTLQTYPNHIFFLRYAVYIGAYLPKHSSHRAQPIYW